MSAIGKGDWVQCVRTDAEEGDPCSVFAGRTYYCEGLINGLVRPEYGLCLCGTIPTTGLVLSGVTAPGCGWCPCNFRPLGGGVTAERRELADA